jgi:hypothetical protein
MISLSPLLLELLAAAKLAQAPEFAATLRAAGLAGRALPLWGFASVEFSRSRYATRTHRGPLIRIVDSSGLKLCWTSPGPA